MHEDAQQFLPFRAGATAPPGWNWSRAQRLSDTLKARREQSEFEAEVAGRANALQSAIWLARDVIRKPEWKVLDQCARGTCNAFAVTAAEELARYRALPDGGMVQLSPEQLYHSMRDIHPRTLIDDLDEVVLENYETSGTTFLAQALFALAKTGVCERDYVPYRCEEAVNFSVPGLSDDARTNASLRKVRSENFVHNLFRKAEIGGHEVPSDAWRHPISKPTVSEVFHEALRNGFPVVASFACPEDIFHDTWWSSTAQESGEVKYPLYVAIDDNKPIGGHSVCIVGYEPNESDRTEGWFVFRNSLGDELFAHSYWDDDQPPRAPAAGYGYISTKDVDVYCWEYLYRTSDEDIRQSAVA